jgi:hypothetical protein
MTYFCQRLWSFRSISGNRLSNTSVSAPVLLQWLPRLSRIVVFPEHFRVAETRKVRGTWRMLPDCHAVLGKVLFGHQRPMHSCVVVKEKPAVSCPFFWTFHSHCVPEKTEEFYAHFSLLNKWIVHETLRIEVNLQLYLRFALFLAEFLFPKRLFGTASVG